MSLKSDGRLSLIKKVNKRDIIVIVIFLIIALLLYSIIRIPMIHNEYSDRADGVIKIYIGTDTEPIKTVPIGIEDKIVIEQDGGLVNEIIVDERGVYMSASTCKGQDCIHQGRIEADNRYNRALGNWIICLPNKVSIEYAGE